MLIHTDTVTRGHQSWIRTVTVTISENKVRVVIERDGYDRQSRIFTEVWSPSTLAWNRIETREGTEYSELPSYVTTDESKIRIATSELLHDMLDYAELILL